MSHSPLLASFDPFATHPFTNNSGLAPRPPLPSQYPIPIPSPRAQVYYPSSNGDYSDNMSASPSSPPSTQSSPPGVYSPQPRRRAPGSPHSHSPAQPIFVPFRQESSSPDLVLKKKRPTQSNSSAPKPQS
ncbi:hypothetical protein BDQ12DRAFT_677118 [Crucibulum laeve]|uniref:Uncharacterized protein n=1 Tax=Crucibulum laeve TaxID=68775 RepID=A0A5C3ME85_9AGAR|nr:hypothetical protein BDQ12DRAFT_677118 [Crucibulum laeve]